MFENLRCSVLWSLGYRYCFWRNVDTLHDAGQLALATLGEIGLAARRDVAAGVLTYAEQRALEIGITIAGGANVILLDEPTAGMHREAWLAAHKPEIYWSMLETAETVARRYGISRERQDEYGVQSQQRAAAAAAAGRFRDEIVPMTVTMGVADKETSHIGTKEVTIAADEGIRADTTYEGVAKIKPALPGGTVAAGNASQFSDGAAACVVMSDTAAASRGLKPLGIFRAFAVAGCEPDEMGIGPVFAVRKLLARTGMETKPGGQSRHSDDAEITGRRYAPCINFRHVGSLRDAMTLPSELRQHLFADFDRCIARADDLADGLADHGEVCDLKVAPKRSESAARIRPTIRSPSESVKVQIGRAHV